MIIDFRNKLVFLATTKVASSSLQLAFTKVPLTGKLAGHPRLKHIDYRTYLKIAGPLRLTRFSTVAPVRHPFDKAVSWYKFRSRESARGRQRFTGTRCFSEFIQSLSKAEVRLICDRRFVTDPKTNRQVDYIIKYEDIQQLFNFLRELYGGKFFIEKRNVSPDITSNFEEARSEFEQRFESEVKWYNDLQTSDLTGWTVSRASKSTVAE